MDLPDETADSFDPGLLPARLHAALAEYWNDNESERTNIDLVSRWLKIADDRSGNAMPKPLPR